MSGAATTYYTARFLLPDYLVRARDTTITCPIRHEGANVVPTAGTVTVTDSSGTTISTGPAVLGSGVATYTVAAAEVPASLSVGSGWRVSWLLTLTGETDARTFENKAALVLSELYTVVALADLYRRQPSLDPDGDTPIHSMTSAEIQGFLDESWVSLVGQIAGKGPLPFLIVEPTALREVHMLLTLTLLFDAFVTRLNETWADQANAYRQRYRAAWRDLRFEYNDLANGGGSSSRKRPTSGGTYFCRRYGT